MITLVKLLYTEKEIAAMTGYTVAGLRFRRCMGNPLFPYRKIGRMVRYDLDDVKKAIETHPKIELRE